MRAIIGTQLTVDYWMVIVCILFWSAGAEVEFQFNLGVTTVRMPRLATSMSNLLS